MADAWRLEVLGDFRVTVDGAVVPLGTGALRLLVALVGPMGGEAGREELRRLLWAEPPKTVMAGFRNVLSDVVQVGLVVASEHRVWVQGHITSDLDDFRSLVRDGDRLAGSGAVAEAAAAFQAALARWRGRVHRPAGVGAVFSAWCDAIDGERREAELRLARLLLGNGDAAGAWRALARPVAGGDRTAEVVRVAATAAFRTGDVPAALTLVRDALADVADLGLVNPDLQRLERDLLNGTLHDGGGVHQLPPELRGGLVDIVGRTSERRRLSNPLGYVQMVVGVSGIGKSALVASAVHEFLSTTPAEVVVVQGRRREQERLGPWRTALRRPFADGTAVIEWVWERGSRSPLLLVVEDLHWCDAATLDVVRRIAAEGLPSRHIGVIVTAWPGEHSDELRLLRSVRVIELRGLIGDELEAYCRTTLHCDVADISTELLDAADGNPLLLSVAAVDAGPTDRTALGRTLLARLDAPARVAVVVALLFDDVVDVAWCNRVVASVDPSADPSVGLADGGLGALSAVLSVGILVMREGRVVVRHDLIREAVLAATSPDVLRLACRGVLAADGSPAWARAKAATQLLGELPRSAVLDAVAVGASEAESHRRFGDAVELLEGAAAIHDRIIEPAAVARLLLRAATNAEAAGTVRGEHLRAEAFDLAERAGDRELMLSVVAVPSALGRPITDAASLQRSARILSLFDAADERRELVMVRAERLSLLPLLADYTDADRALIEWARDYVRRIESGPLRRSVARGYLCATVGGPRLERWDQMLAELVDEVIDEPWPDGGDPVGVDVRADVLSLAFRRAFEFGDLRRYVRLADRLPRPVGPRRPADEWIRLMFSALEAMLRGNLASARNLSKAALDYGRRTAVPDHELGWLVHQLVWRIIDVEVAVGGSAGDEDVTSASDAPPPPTEPAPTANARIAGAGLRAMISPEPVVVDIEALTAAYRPDSFDVSRLAAAATTIEWCWRLGRPAPTPMVDVLVPLRGDHVILGFAPGWSLGPAWRLVTLARLLRGDIDGPRAERTLARLGAACERRGQLTWAMLSARTIAEVVRRDGRDPAAWEREEARLRSMMVL